MRILIDMNLTPRWVPYLRSAGHDAVHWHSVGSGCARDRDIYEYAREHAYALLTNDVDFPQILAHTKQSAPSIIVLRGEPLVPETRGSAVVRALTDCGVELQRGAVLTLDWSDRPRARILPLL
jgi:predicted nuclease of predicted toxin-antitoxin system